MLKFGVRYIIGGAAIMFAAACTGKEEAPAIDTTSAASTTATAAPTSPVGSLNVARDDKGGPYLVDGAGRALYLFEKDSEGQSSCDAACAAAWPPFVVAGVPTATDTSVQAPLITTIQRADGRQQAAYNGHPLYYYARDAAPGEFKGQDVEEFGEEWYLVAPDGSKQQKRPKAGGTGEHK